MLLPAGGQHASAETWHSLQHAGHHEGVEVLDESTGDGGIAHEQARLDVALVSGGREIGGRDEGDLVVDHDALGVEHGPRTAAGSKRPRVVEDLRTTQARPLSLQEAVRELTQKFSFVAGIAGLAAYVHEDPHAEPWLGVHSGPGTDAVRFGCLRSG